MAETVTFDIYVRTDERWQRYETFTEAQHEDAMQIAAEMDLEPETNGVRIIKVTSFGENRAPLETLEWISPSLKRHASHSEIIKRNKARAANEAKSKAVSKSTETSDAARKRNQRKKKAKSSRKNHLSLSGPLILKGLGIMLVAAALSFGLFGPVAYVLKEIDQSGTQITPLYQEAIAFTICAIVFFMIASLSFRMFLTARYLQKEATKRSPTPKRKPEPSNSPPRQSEPVIETLQEDETTRIEPATPELSEYTETMPPTTLDEEYRRSMLKFLEGSLVELADILKTIDPYSLFGINLFLGGAGDQFSTINGLGGIQKYILIRETISALGTQSDMVAVFCEKFSDYDQDPKYRFMTDAGRKILEKYLANETNCFKELPDLIKRWQKSNASIAQAQGIITIMFTDLVGSTQMTHDHGDIGAQEVVRAHNAIVRNALAQYHGEEVKHTGDGIMASFANAPNSVRATIEIQREIVIHNNANPAIPVRVRIGLNAGDAVREENDFFGQTVQLAARICDKADEKEIYITPSVHALCIDHAFDFTEAGQYELKGIDQPVQAYAVGWNDGPTASDTEN